MTTTVRIQDSTTLRYDQELMARVDALAKKEMRTRTMMMRVLIIEALEARERQEKRSACHAAFCGSSSL